MTSDLAIVILAWKRKNVLEILNQISNDNTSLNCDLIVSLDGGFDEDIHQNIKDFKWKFGVKSILIEQNNLGVDKHTISVFKKVLNYNHIILLEDDIWVSPFFWNFIESNLKYININNTASIALNSLSINPFFGNTFQYFNNKSNGVYIQKVCTWGCVLKKEIIEKFLFFIENPNFEVEPFYNKKWGMWERLFNMFLIKNQLFVLYPKYSISANLNYIGEHIKTKRNEFQFQNAMAIHDFEFMQPEKFNYYDAWLELDEIQIKKINSKFEIYNFDVDLNGNKELELLTKPFVLTSKKCKNPIYKFGRILKPIELNILFEMEGNDILLCKRENILKQAKFDFRKYSYYRNPANIKMELLSKLFFKLPFNWLKLK